MILHVYATTSHIAWENMENFVMIYVTKDRIGVILYTVSTMQQYGFKKHLPAVA